MSEALTCISRPKVTAPFVEAGGNDMVCCHERLVGGKRTSITVTGITFTTAIV